MRLFENGKVGMKKQILRASSLGLTLLIATSYVALRSDSDTGRVLGLTGGGALIGGLAGGRRGAGIGAATGLGIGLLTRRRGRRRSREYANFSELKRERRSVERELQRLDDEITAIEDGRIEVSKKEIGRLKRRQKRLERQLEELEDEIENTR